MASWEKEKAYYAKRAQELRAEMDRAILSADKERFEKAHQTAMRYMTKRERSAYYRRFLEAMIARRAEA